MLGRAKNSTSVIHGRPSVERVANLRVTSNIISPGSVRRQPNVQVRSRKGFKSFDRLQKDHLRSIEDHHKQAPCTLSLFKRLT